MIGNMLEGQAPEYDTKVNGHVKHWVLRVVSGTHKHICIFPGLGRPADYSDNLFRVRDRRAIGF